MATESFPYSFKVNAARVVDKDHTINLEPEKVHLQAVSKAYDLEKINSLNTEFILKPYRKAGVRVVGRITAKVVQTCVVSLEPFESDMTLNVDRTFEPVSGKLRKVKDLNEDGEIEIDLETLDPPDVMVDGILDLGAVICEELALSLDPFPRRPGVEFETLNGDGAEVKQELEGKPSPFAALRNLKDETGE